ncbi:MAG TPA: hypothetical protein P5077_03155 [bacterium]|nr:hypothetical protein [bacterium]
MRRAIVVPALSATVLIFVLLLARGVVAPLFFPGERTADRTIDAFAAAGPPGALPEPAERADREAAASLYRRKATEAIGLQYLSATESAVRAVGEDIVTERYRFRRLVVTAAGPLEAPANLYLPVGAPEPFPALVFVAGDGNGKGYAPYRRLAATLAASGIAVFLLDLPGVGERAEGDPGIVDLLSLGITIPGIATREVLAAAGWLRGFPGVDGGRIMAAGHAEGGTAALYALALDPRLSAGALLLSLDDHGAMIREKRLSELSRVTLFSRRDIEQHHLVGLVAPRPLLVVAGKKDRRRTAAATETVRKGRVTYRFLGAEEELDLVVADGSGPLLPSHRAVLYEFLRDHGLPAGRLDEEEDPPSERDTVVGIEPVPAGALAAFAAREAASIRAAIRTMRDTEGPLAYATRLAELLRDLSGEGLFGPATHEAVVREERTVEKMKEEELSFYPAPDTVLTARLTGPFLPARAVIVATGTGAAGRLAAVLRSEGLAVLEMELRRGSAENFLGVALTADPERRTAAAALVAGVPLAFLRAQDILSAVAYLRNRTDRVAAGPIGLYADGPEATLAALLAANLSAELAPVALTDTPLTMTPGAAPVPGMALHAAPILRLADIGDLISACAPRRMLIGGARGPGGGAVDTVAIREQVWETRHLVVDTVPDRERIVRFFLTGGTTPAP